MYLAGHGPGDDGAAGFHARLAQSVEHAAVNRSVVGSSPTTSATLRKVGFWSTFFRYLTCRARKERLIFLVIDDIKMQSKKNQRERIENNTVRCFPR